MCILFYFKHFCSFLQLGCYPRYFVLKICLDNLYLSYWKINTLFLTHLNNIFVVQVVFIVSYTTFWLIDVARYVLHVLLCLCSILYDLEFENSYKMYAELKKQSSTSGSLSSFSRTILLTIIHLCLFIIHI